MAITIGWNSLFLQLHMICLRWQHSYGCFWQTWPLHVMWSYQMWTWAGPYNNGSSWLAEEGRLAVMTMTTMVVEVLDGDHDDDNNCNDDWYLWWQSLRWRWQQWWWLVLMMTIAVMMMTTMVVEVLDGDSGKDRQWSVLITRLMTCTSIPIVQRSANTNKSRITNT